MPITDNPAHVAIDVYSKRTDKRDRQRHEQDRHFHSVANVAMAFESTRPRRSLRTPTNIGSDGAPRSRPAR